MRILIVGAGGREHALAWWCRRGRDDVELIVAPGNAGTADIAENVVADVTDAAGISRLAQEREVDVVVIGPDAAAAAGVADACVENGIAVFGPSRAAARIESSKTFAKRLMRETGIPTARWIAGGAYVREMLSAFIEDLNGRVAVKADGLTLGKGVTVCDSVEQAEAAVTECFDARRFGVAGESVVVEERLEGPEVSVFAFSDGTNIRVLPPARDHKRAYEGDTGPNTGGMGAVAPPPGVADDFVDNVAVPDVLQPCIDALRNRGMPFVGCLYAGLMLTADGVRVIEFNARLGDPEAQVVLPLVDEDGADLILAAASARLEPGRTRTRAGAAAGIVAAAAGYPDAPRTGDVITGLDALDAGVLVFQAGTRRSTGGALLTSGGRVLCVVATGASLADARSVAYENLARVHFEGMQYRRDIGGALVTAPSEVAP